MFWILTCIVGLGLANAKMLPLCDGVSDLVQLCKLEDHHANKAPSPLPCVIRPQIGIFEIIDVDYDEKTMTLLTDLYMIWSDSRISLGANEISRYTM